MTPEVFHDLAAECVSADIRHNGDGNTESRERHSEVARLPGRRGNMTRSSNLLAPRREVRHAADDQIDIEVADDADRSGPRDARYRVGRIRLILESQEDTSFHGTQRRSAWHVASAWGRVDLHGKHQDTLSLATTAGYCPYAYSPQRAPILPM